MSRVVRVALLAPLALGLCLPHAATAQAAKKPAPKAAGKAAPKPTAKGNVTRAQLQRDVRGVFGRADTDKDGFMSLQEFAVRMGAILNRAPGPGEKGAPTKEAMQKMLDAATAAFKAADTNGDGKLDLKESGARALSTFDALDANHDGVLTLAEKAAAREKLAAVQRAQAPRKLQPGR